MIKFKPATKGYITQLFDEGAEVYKDRGKKGHGGVDSVNGWNYPTTGDNAGYIYKVVYKHQSHENWQGVYQLVKIDEKRFVEVGMGHFNTIIVKEGWHVPEGAVWGLEGNKGFVRSSGQRITTEMQENGDRRGAHVHTWYRPVLRTKHYFRSNYYLEKDGKPYRDEDGYYYQVIHKDNGYKGCVDPYTFTYSDTLADKIRILKNLIPYFIKHFTR